MSFRSDFQTNVVRSGPSAWRGYGAAYSPRPDRRVRRAVRQLLNEPDQHRRGGYAWALVTIVVAACMLAGVRW